MAVLMLGVFFFIIAAQAFHQHQYASPKGDSEDEEYVYTSDKCKICDYVLHKQSKHAIFRDVPLFSHLSTKPVTLLSKSYAGIYKFTLQGFTNKGPPALFA